MKTPKKKKSKEELEIEANLPVEEEDGRAVPFEALAELTSSDVIAQVKRAMGSIEPIDLIDEIGTRINSGEFPDADAARRDENRNPVHLVNHDVLVFFSRPPCHHDVAPLLLELVA